MKSRSTASRKTAQKTATKKASAPRHTLPAFHFDISDTPDGIRTSIKNHLKFTLARDRQTAGERDWWLATALAVRDRIMERFIQTMGVHHEANARRVYYLSLEYLMGRLLHNNLINCGLFDATKEAIERLNEEEGLGLDLGRLEDEEVDMGLGNGGLGRLAACFLDSLATLDLPAVGYGIYYEFGLFRQKFENGRQVELPDNWLQFKNPWIITRTEYAQEVRLYGRVETRADDKGDCHPEWVDGKTIVGVPKDIPIVGYGGCTVNFLRLWESKASEEFDLTVFNEGGYTEAVQEKARSETVTKVLYPNDTSESGKELRLVQQYFFVCCSLHDIIRRYRKRNEGWEAFPEKVAVHLNDTHPAVAVAELMRILVDEEHVEWDHAWTLCRKVFAYTNHTLLPEALEKWSVPLFEKVLPRHLQIIFEINRRFLEDEVEAKWPGDDAMKAALSLIEEGHPKMVRMAHLSVVGSHAVNGVAALHTELLQNRVFPTFNELYPGKFQNKTNGITPRRWLKGCNPGLSALLDEKVGPGWPADLDALRVLEKDAGKKAFQEAFMKVKHGNKEKLAEVIAQHCGGLEVDPAALFDVQIKRLHEYKRQHLNLLHIVALYRRLLHDPSFDCAPRVFLFGAKAAPGYALAKNIIYAINAVAARINHDPRINGRLKVVFLPNYGVTMAERIIPAADLSEQISTAGKEASGTGNMKLSLNGALTIGTLDGANVEIRDEVGEENIFIFGLTVDEVEELRARGYNPYDYYYASEELRGVLDWLASGYFTPDDPHGLQPLVHSLLGGGDPYLVLADFGAYAEAQSRVDALYKDRSEWARKAILNTARMGKFSTDRTISQYAEEIWNLKPLPGVNGV